MKVINRPDFPVTDEAAKEATGKTLAEWYAELDSIDGLAKGRREMTQYLYAQKADAWWQTTIATEYEKHKGVTKKDGLAEGYTICVTKTIAAPVDKVYSIWVDPSKFDSWYGDGGQQAVIEGGSIGCSGGTKGSFTRIRENKDLRFTWEHPGCTAPMTVDVQFQDNKGKTLMNVMTSRIQTRAEADGLREAWAGALARLKALSEG